ncbi:hypothetical protein CYMTET_31995 [Cymbomonas tetramitiformis]|uniref:Uncharacterized protein n=1 Tax=Cymbomonas tetramitiformis TaxID=36881 RepID=A0AAE0FG10_9CHLO|nr:hypothetical protein CYMTET_31995 [Cymbomonas tetramitiformis]
MITVQSEALSSTRGAFIIGEPTGKGSKVTYKAPSPGQPEKAATAAGLNMTMATPKRHLPTPFSETASQPDHAGAASARAATYVRTPSSTVLREMEDASERDRSATLATPLC